MSREMEAVAPADAFCGATCGKSPLEHFFISRTIYCMPASRSVTGSN